MNLCPRFRPASRTARWPRHARACRSFLGGSTTLISPESPVRAGQPQPQRPSPKFPRAPRFLRRILQNIPQQAHCRNSGASCLMASARRWRISAAKSALRDFLRAGYVASERLFARAPSSSSDRICRLAASGSHQSKRSPPMRDHQRADGLAFHAGSR